MAPILYVLRYQVLYLRSGRYSIDYINAEEYSVQGSGIGLFTVDATRLSARLSFYICMSCAHPWGKDVSEIKSNSAKLAVGIP